MFYNQTAVQSSNKSYTKNNNKFIIDSNSFIMDEDLRFQVEKIPSGLNPLDLIRFKNLSTSSINGNIIKVFTLKEYLVYLYTPLQNKAKALLLSKIDFLQSIVSESIHCELWIIYDTNYLCVGIFNSVPIFIKSFKSIAEINDHMHMMTENMNQYTMIQNIRFFCCNSEHFTKNNANIFEYSEQFMSEIMSGQLSINEYCKELQQQRKIQNTQNIWSIIIMGITILICGILFYVSEVINNKTRLTIEHINSFKRKGILPSEAHYKCIKEIEYEFNK